MYDNQRKMKDEKKYFISFNISFAFWGMLGR